MASVQRALKQLSAATLDACQTLQFDSNSRRFTPIHYTSDRSRMLCMLSSESHQVQEACSVDASFQHMKFHYASASTAQVLLQGRFSLVDLPLVLSEEEEAVVMNPERSPCQFILGRSGMPPY